MGQGWTYKPNDRKKHGILPCYYSMGIENMNERCTVKYGSLLNVDKQKTENAFYGKVYEHFLHF
jgi:hypothetical protein